ncbi:zinc-binding alcohol dehydrogenase family protein [Planctomycetales bacterium ZRK34]|nr:zinc-binding alcohol dehydrogenase family protein [Planctomycetales bacterium ZRK34]
MRAIRLEEPKRFEYVDIESPALPGPGQALVRTHRMGICGTDLSGYLGKMPFMQYPRILGHELGVEVIEVGPGVTNVSVGDRCSVEPYMNCGQCHACRKGATNCCAKLNVIGVMIDGGLCEQFLIRADKLHVSKKLSYEQLALVETLAIGCHAVDRGAPQAGENVLIVGAGPIGLATIEFVKLTGARTIVADLNAQRLKFCKQVMGVDETLLVGEDFEQQLREVTRGDKADVVIDATGHVGSMSAAFGYIAPMGRLVYVGITTQEVRFAHPMFHKPEGTLLCSRNALPRDFTRIIELIETGRIDTGPWITHRVGYDDFVRQFDQFTRPETGAIKAIVQVTDE